ncbi:MAG: glycosyltransferase family 4 protein, partial [Roseiflexaceae bacterium]
IPNPPVICVAQWSPRKGIDALLRAWAHVGARHVPLHLYGETDAHPGYAATCEQLLVSLQAAEFAVTVQGSVSDTQLRDAYATARLFVLPSRFEGYGMAFAEAIWAGVPVVGYAIPSAQRIVADAGTLVPIDDEAALAQALAPYCADATHQPHLHSALYSARASLPRWQDTAFAWLVALHHAPHLASIPTPYAYRAD